MREFYFFSIINYTNVFFSSILNSSTIFARHSIKTHLTFENEPSIVQFLRKIKQYQSKKWIRQVWKLWCAFSADSGDLRARISINWRYTAHGLLVSARDVLRQAMCFGSQSPDFLFFWRSLSCVTVCPVIEMRVRKSPPSGRKSARGLP